MYSGATAQQRAAFEDVLAALGVTEDEVMSPSGGQQLSVKLEHDMYRDLDSVAYRFGVPRSTLVRGLVASFLAKVSST